jgi:phosphate transport system permease protein
MNNEIISSAPSRLKRRYFFNWLFRGMGLLAIIASCLFLVIIISSIVIKGYRAFLISEINLTIKIDHSNNNYQHLIEQAFSSYQIEDRNKIYEIISEDAEFKLKKYISDNPSIGANEIKLWLPAAGKLDMYEKNFITKDKFDPSIFKVIENLHEQKLIRTSFNIGFLTSGDSRQPESAGVGGSIIGSFFTIFTCMLVSFPLAVSTAVYLEEYAPKNKLTYFVEVNINNLAAVPSIVFGLLGLAIFLGKFGMPRSSSLAGGVTLSLMVLPTMIITTRTALKTIPASIKQAVMALGASDLQILIHHTLPLAMPGIMTGAILAISRAIGETAPLIMIGMVAFIADVPHNLLDPATVMPVQIFLWADSPELAFVEKTSAAIVVLLLILLVMNIISAILRKKYEIRW